MTNTQVSPLPDIVSEDTEEVLLASNYARLGTPGDYGMKVDPYGELEQPDAMKETRTARVLFAWACDHEDHLNFAIGMCRMCYRKKVRHNVKAWACEHTDRAHSAKGLCNQCY